MSTNEDWDAIADDKSEWIDPSYTVEKRDVMAHIRETKGSKLHYAFVRLVKDVTEVEGGIDAIYTVDMNQASVDFDASGKMIGITLYWD